MRRRTENNQHPVFRLGKAPAERDERNFQLRALLRAAVKLPQEYDFDTNHRAIPTPMFANDQRGDCVIAARAHQTLRFELLEQKKIIKISDDDVLNEYFDQSGGADAGVVALESLRLWRLNGWLIGRKRYYIRAYAEINRQSRQEMKRAIYMDLGVGIGLRLPTSAQKELNAGKPWRQTTGAHARANSWGGHYVYVTGYTRLGPTCVTWGRKQQMSWAFFQRYCDEAYATIDAANTAKMKRGLKSGTLDNMLGTVLKSKERSQPKRHSKRARRS